MATKAEKVLRIQTIKSTGLKPEYAAIKYVKQGIRGLGLKPQEKAALEKKLIPIVTQEIANDRKRTAARAKGIVGRETKARIKKASEL